MLKFDKAGKNNHWFLDIKILKLNAFDFYLCSFCNQKMIFKLKINTFKQAIIKKVETNHLYASLFLPG